VSVFPASRPHEPGWAASARRRAHARYRTTEAEDDATIARASASPREKVAARLLRIEKRILRGAAAPGQHARLSPWHGARSAGGHGSLCGRACPPAPCQSGRSHCQGSVHAALCSNRHGPGGRPMAAPGQPSAPRRSQEQRPTRTCFQGVLPCAAPLSALAGSQCAHDHANLWAPQKLAPAQARWTACCSCRARSRLPRWSRGRRCPASGCRRRSTRARLRRLLGRRDAWRGGGLLDRRVCFMPYFFFLGAK